jgi:predicted enzyme related to lactoylglutathione lyase
MIQRHILSAETSIGMRRIAMFKLTELRSWNLQADDLDAMVHFYRDGLGADEAMRHTVGGVPVARMKVGASGLGLFDASETRAPGVPHHTFNFEGPTDPQEMVRELAERGIKVENIRTHGEGPGYSVYVTDPSGNYLELSTDPPRK